MSEEITLHESDETPAIRFQRFRLVGIAGPAEGLEEVLGDQPLTIGRSKSADIRLDDKLVSRKHSSVEPDPRGYKVRDLGSANGTYLDGRRVEVAFLEPGAVVRVGDSEFKFTSEDVTLGRRPAGEEVLPGVLGRSKAMRDLADQVKKLGPVDLPVLIHGESGTGKELLARNLHAEGARPDGPYVVVDCTLLTGEHLRSELFGHVKGAFTGADKDRAGAFARAHGGTLFLDEVGELPLDLQPHLLRVLEQGEIRPLGGEESQQVSVRVVAATHRDLKARVSEDLFRQDLYYRLSALSVEVPPLRARGDDVMLVAERLLPEGARLDESARKALLNHPWPGNVRELRNTLQRAAALAGNRLIRPEDLALDAGHGQPLEAPGETLETLEARAIQEALAACDGNRKEAAKRLGIARSTFYSKLKKLGLD